MSQRLRRSKMICVGAVRTRSEIRVEPNLVRPRRPTDRRSVHVGGIAPSRVVRKHPARYARQRVTNRRLGRGKAHRQAAIWRTGDNSRATRACRVRSTASAKVAPYQSPSRCHRDHGSLSAVTDDCRPEARRTGPRRPNAQGCVSNHAAQRTIGRNAVAQSESEIAACGSRHATLAAQVAGDALIIPPIRGTAQLAVRRCRDSDSKSRIESDRTRACF